MLLLFSFFVKRKGFSRTVSRHILKSQPKLGLTSTLSCKGSWEMETFGLEMSGDGTDVGEGGLRMAGVCSQRGCSISEFISRFWS